MNACGHQPDDGFPLKCTCTLPEGHEGNHTDGMNTWFRQPIVMPAASPTEHANV